MLFYPTIADSSIDFEQLLEAYPPEMIEIFGIEDFNFSKFEVYISAEYYSFFWAVVFIPFFISWSLNFVRERWSGVMALQLTKGINRDELYLSSVINILVKAFYTALIMTTSVLLFVPFLDNVTVQLDQWMKFGLMLMGLFSLIGSMGLFFGSLIRKPGQVSGILSAFVVLGYFLNILSKLVEDAEPAKYLSIFYYYGSPDKLLTGGDYMTSTVIVFGVLPILFFFLGWIVFRKVDI